MPYLLIQTNVDISEAAQDALLKTSSTMLATQLGKPVGYMMAGIAPMQRMIFAGTDGPTAFLILKSIGLPESKLKALSAALCTLVSEHTDIPPKRIYIEFVDVQARYWGHNGGTFG
jgi:phenylpyruvate tautomerase